MQSKKIDLTKKTVFIFRSKNAHPDAVKAMSVTVATTGSPTVSRTCIVHANK